MNDFRGVFEYPYKDTIMADIESTEDYSIPVQRIISVACRNFMAFDGLHTFEFNEKVNTIVGGNSSGKSLLINIISRVLSKNFFNSKLYNINEMQEALIEIKFIANDEEHYLRRVLLGDTTTDLHLYVGNDGKQVFYRDGEVIEYLRKLKPISAIDGFEVSRNDFFFWTNGENVNMNPTFCKSKDVIQGINQFLPIAHSEVVELHLKENEVMAQYRNGELRYLSTLASSDGKIIFIIAKIYNILKKISNDNSSKVILADELDIGLDVSKIKGLYDVIKSIADKLDCQFIITTRFVNGRMNPIRINKSIIPRCYIENKATNLHQLIKNYSASFKSFSGLKSPPYNKNKPNQLSGKISYKKGLFKWNP